MCNWNSAENAIRQKLKFRKEFSVKPNHLEYFEFYSRYLQAIKPLSLQQNAYYYFTFTPIEVAKLSIYEIYRSLNATLTYVKISQILVTT